MNHLNQYHANLRGSVILECGQESDDLTLKKEFFVRKIKQMLVEANAIGDFNECLSEIQSSRTDGPTQHFHLDGYTINAVASGTAELVYVDWSDAEQPENYTDARLEYDFAALLSFFTLSLIPNYWRQPGGNIYAMEAASKIGDNMRAQTIRTVHLIIITNRKAKLASEEGPPLGDLRVRRSVIDIERLHGFAEGHKTRQTIDVDVAVDFPGTEIVSIPPHAVRENAIEMNIYVGIVPGKLLASLYQTHGARLMESNVRSYLQERGTINKGIMKTTATQPGRFLPYNNGICCTASGVKTDMVEGACRITHIHDLQIVNGGQTTATLFTYMAKNGKDSSALDQLMVAFKLITIKEKADAAKAEAEALEIKDAIANTTDTLVQAISRFSNSQNKISEVDLSANSTIQRTLEQVSRQVTESRRKSHYYYERTKGSYVTEEKRATSRGAAELRLFQAANPPSQKLDKIVHARIENLWQQLPYVVCRGAQTSFTHMNNRFKTKTPLIDTNYYKQLCAKFLILDHMEKTLRSEGHRGLIASYANYLVAHLVNATGNRLDLNSIWNRQGLSEALTRQIKESIRTNYDHLASIIESRVSEGKRANPLSAFAQPTTWNNFLKICDNDILQELKAELLDTPLRTVLDEQSMQQERWEEIQFFFSEKSDTIDQLLQTTGKQWPTDNYDPASHLTDYTNLGYKELMAMRTLTKAQKKKLIEVLQAYMKCLNEC